MSVDRRSIHVLLASLEIDQGELAERMGYGRGYVVNVLNGFTRVSPGFRGAFGEALAELLLGDAPVVEERYPAAPLFELIRGRAAQAPSKREFYEDLGLSWSGWNNREFVTGSFVDRICCALGVHPSSVYGRDYDLDDVS